MSRHFTDALRADHTVHFSYRRSVGGLTERFLAGLAGAQVWGVRSSDGRVLVPPVDHDPQTGAPLTELVPVGDSGVVRSWTWVNDPSPEHPVGRPFAFALIQLDGADTTLLHAVDAIDEAAMRTGMQVQADWRPERCGSVRDIRAFLPATPAADGSAAGGMAGAAADPPEPVEVVSDVRLSYGYAPGLVLSGFLRALGDGRIEAGHCPGCGSVYVPPRPRCPACGGGPMTPRSVDGRGAIVAYTVVHVPPPGPAVEVPFAWAWIRLDAADVPFAHLLGDVDLAQIRVGQPVEPVWVDADELAPTWASIRHFRPVPRTVPQ